MLVVTSLHGFDDHHTQKHISMDAMLPKVLVRGQVRDELEDMFPMSTVKTI